MSTSDGSEMKNALVAGRSSVEPTTPSGSTGAEGYPRQQQHQPDTFPGGLVQEQGSAAANSSSSSSGTVRGAALPIGEKRNLLLTEMSSAVATLQGINSVMDEILALIGDGVDGADAAIDAPARAPASSDATTAPVGILRKQELLLKELEEWKDVIVRR